MQDPLDLAIKSAIELSGLGDVKFCVNLIIFYLKNIISDPNNPKFRKVNSSNPNYIWKIGYVQNATDIMLASGFVKTDENTFETNEDVEKLTKYLVFLENTEKTFTNAIARIPRKGVFGEKKLSRAFCDFQGSTRFVVGFGDYKGIRPMEDEIVILGMGPRFRYQEDYYAVFDGHGGTDAAVYAATTLHDRIDKNFCTNGGDVIKALVKAFHDTNSYMCNHRGMICGTCALVTYISGKNLYIANLGDSRAILGCRGRYSIAMTKDHKPELPEEVIRITALPGGFVQPPNRTSAVHRVMGRIAVSRALGSRNVKPYVSDDPDIYHVVLSDDDYFLILACDGIWDVISTQDASDVVFASNDPQTASTRLIKLALERFL